MANIAVKVELTDEERKELASLGRSRKTALARRAAAAEGLTNKEAKLKMTAAPPLCGAPSRRPSRRTSSGGAAAPTTTLPTWGRETPLPTRCGKRFRRRRNEKFRKFLDYLPSDIHMDNYATRKTEAAGSPGARAGASAAPRPRGQVERFFGLLTEKQPRRDGCRSTADLGGPEAPARLRRLDIGAVEIPALLQQRFAGRLREAG